MSNEDGNICLIWDIHQRIKSFLRTYSWQQSFLSKRKTRGNFRAKNHRRRNRFSLWVKVNSNFYRIFPFSSKQGLRQTRLPVPRYYNPQTPWMDFNFSDDAVRNGIWSLIQFPSLFIFSYLQQFARLSCTRDVTSMSHLSVREPIREPTQT